MYLNSFLFRSWWHCMQAIRIQRIAAPVMTINTHTPFASKEFAEYRTRLPDLRRRVVLRRLFLVVRKSDSRSHGGGAFCYWHAQTTVRYFLCLTCPACELVVPLRRCSLGASQPASVPNLSQPWSQSNTSAETAVTTHRFFLVPVTHELTSTRAQR